MKCWEFKKCGREKGGLKVNEFGICPAYPNHGIHCAKIKNTLCGNKVQESHATKLMYCMRCDFYNSPNYDKSYTGFNISTINGKNLPRVKLGVLPDIDEKIK